MGAFYIDATGGITKLRTGVEVRSPTREAAEEAFEQWMSDGIVTIDDFDSHAVSRVRERQRAYLEATHV